MNATEQMQVLQRAELESAFDMGKSMLGGFERVIRLNLEVLRDSTQQATELLRAALSARDLQDLMNARAGNPLRSGGDRAADYARRLAEIAAGTQAEMAETMNQNMLRLREAMQQAVGGGAADDLPAVAAPAQAFLKGFADFAAQALDAMRNTQGEAVKAVTEQAQRLGTATAAKPRRPAGTAHKQHA